MALAPPGASAAHILYLQFKNWSVMHLDLASKTAVVTGAGRGIGLATVRALTAEGVRVVGAARTLTPELKETGAHAVSADLSTADGVATLMDSAFAELGGIDLLVNNVGAGSTWSPSASSTPMTLGGPASSTSICSVRSVSAARPCPA
jgi:NAD(P)-dependent dehydrogenase (short-subunit alcohol dehydrogenase family)